MDVVVTLVAAPTGGLDRVLVEGAGAAIRAAGGAAGAADWLAPGRACDIPVGGLEPAAAAAAARTALAGRAVDVAGQAAAGRRKRLLVADMDATIVVGETLDEVAARAGIADEIAPITAAAMNGEIDFPEALRRRVALLAGHSAALLADTADAMRLSPGAFALVATMRAAGARTCLVSGGFDVFTARAQALAGFDTARGNRILVEDGRITGRIAEPIIGAADKRRTLLEESAALGLAPEAALAVGDGANDLPMLLAAGLGIAFHAKPAVRAAARTRIDHADLAALLFLQGYREDEIVCSMDGGSAPAPERRP